MDFSLQAPLSMEFLMQEYWSGLPFPPPGDLPNPEIEHTSPALQAESLPLSCQGSPFAEISKMNIGALLFWNVRINRNRSEAKRRIVYGRQKYILIRKNSASLWGLQVA